MALAGLDHCIVCTAAADKVLVRHYHIGFQRSGSKVRCGAVLYGGGILWRAQLKIGRVRVMRYDAA